MADLTGGARHAVGDHGFGIGAAHTKPTLELGHRGRQQEQRHEVLTHRGGELLSALPVDVEQDVAAFAQRILHRGLGRSIAMAEDRRPFDEFAGVDHPVELGVVDEMIVDPIGFARALGARRCRNRHRHVAVEQHA
jgi:hypothetical protein